MKLKTFLFTALCIVCTSPVFADFEDGYFRFREGDGSDCSLIGYSGEGGDLTIPSIATKTEGNVTSAYTVTSIGNAAFQDCVALTSIIVPSSVTSIGDWAFSNCAGLDSLTIPNSVTSIGDWTFSNCVGLDSLAIPNSVTSIGNRTFSNCAKLASITIPNSVTSIGYGVFAGCVSLASLTIPNSVTSIGSDAFSNCTGLASIIIPNSVTSIKSGAFQDCSSLNSITIPNSITVIEGWTFFRCTSLNSITIPNSVKTIGDEAFQNCTGLYSVTIPNSVTSIRARAFDKCTALKNITVSWRMPQSVNLDLSLFENVNLVDATLNVPAGTKALYQAHEVWGQFGTIIETSTGGADGISNIANTLPEISLSDRILTVFSPAAEQIYVYSLTGAMLYNASKFSGVVTFNISHLSQGVLIIKGNSGWTQKVILK